MSSFRRTLSSVQWLCLVMLLFIYATPSQGAGRLCGRHLSQALDMICDNGFATKTKKSVDPMDYGMDLYSEDEDNISADLPQIPFLSKIASISLTKTRRRRHGIAHECCDKPCTLSEIRSYCR